MKKPICIYLDEDIIKLLDNAAKKNMTSRSGMITQLVLASNHKQI